MALDKAQAFLHNESPLEVHERIENGRLTGAVLFQVGIVDIPKYKDAIGQFLEANYIIQKFTKEDEAKLQKILKKQKSSYTVHPIEDKTLKRLSLNVSVTVPFFASTADKNLEYMSIVNEFFGFEDFINSNARLYKEILKKRKT